MAKQDKTPQKPVQRIDTLKKIEIPEGVEISIRVAGPVTRASALSLDLLIMGGSIIVMLVIFEWMGTLFGNSLAEGFRLILLFLIYWFYFIFFESGKHGATPGKRAMKLRVVMTDGTPAPLSAVCIRNMLKPIDMMPLMTCGIGLLSCLLTSKFQRLGDLAAGTVVTHAIKTKGARSDKASASAQRAPMVSLTHEEQSAIVAFKERHQQWGPLRSEELAGIIEPVILGRTEDKQRPSLTEQAEAMINQPDDSKAPKLYQHLLEIGEWIQRGDQIERKEQRQDLNDIDPQIEALVEMNVPSGSGVAS